LRFVLAIVAFVAAAVLIGFGIAQRTVFLGPDSVVMSAQLEDPPPYVVVEPEVLSARPGAQTITVTGPAEVFVAYGRTDDMLAWIGEGAYTTVGYDVEDDALVTTKAQSGPVADGGLSMDGRPPTSEPDIALPADPAGSDLWLEEFSDQVSFSTTLDLPEGVSLLLASDGTAAAPDHLRVEWPVENSTPWAGPLIAGGAVAFLLGVAFVISGFVRQRRSRGPRRNRPRGTRRPRLPSAPKPKSIKPNQVTGNHGRRAIGRAPRAAIALLAVIPAVALTSCSSDYWPSLNDFAPSTVAPTASPTSAGAGAVETDEPEAERPQPAVTVPQMERILRKIAVLTSEADTALDLETLQTRFAGPALEARSANYAIRAALPDHPAPPAIPAAPLTLTLPQQTDGMWPRVVMAIAQNADDPTVAPTTLVLVQNSPRENYVVHYAMQLAPEASTPDVAPASVGAPLIAADSKFLTLPPGQLAAAYGDLLLNGTESEFAGLFDTENDLLLQQLGVAGQETIRGSLPATADIAFTNAVGDGPPVALATNDSGALVVVNLTQSETVRPNDGGTIGFEEGSPAAALSGFTDKSAKGVMRVIGLQLVFHVPSAGSDRLIELLGWTESLVSASEVP
jgi:hypothetical protein